MKVCLHAWIGDHPAYLVCLPAGDQNRNHIKRVADFGEESEAVPAPPRGKQIALEFRYARAIATKPFCKGGLAKATGFAQSAQLLTQKIKAHRHHALFHEDWRNVQENIDTPAAKNKAIFRNIS